MHLRIGVAAPFVRKIVAAGNRSHQFRGQAFANPPRHAAAASPNSISSADSGAPSRQSAAATSAVRTLPAATASNAARSAVVPARSDAPKSAVAVSAGRSQAAAIRLAGERCQYGEVVEANESAPAPPDCASGQAAESAMVSESSSKFMTALHPGSLGDPQAAAMTSRRIRQRGTYTE